MHGVRCVQCAHLQSLLGMSFHFCAPDPERDGFHPPRKQPHPFPGNPGSNFYHHKSHLPVPGSYVNGTIQWVLSYLAFLLGIAFEKFILVVWVYNNFFVQTFSWTRALPAIGSITPKDQKLRGRAGIFNVRSVFSSLRANNNSFPKFYQESDCVKHQR